MKTKYKFGFYGERPQLFKSGFNDTGGKETPKNNGGGIVCDGCFDLRKGYERRIRQIVRDCTGDFEHDLELEVKDEMTPTYAKFLSDLCKGSDDFLIKKRKSLCCCIKFTLKYYQTTKATISIGESRN